MSEWDLSKPNRQSVLGVVVYILRNFRAMGSLFLTALVFAAAKPQVWIGIGIAIIPMGVLLSLLAYWQYRNFTFQLDDHDLIIHKGVIFKERVVISADRIQSIKIVENLVQRVLGLVALKVDTAGSAAAELEIPALERKKAMMLKDLLYRKKEEATGAAAAEGQVEAEGSQAGLAQAAAAKSQAPVEKRLLVKLSFFDLVVVGLTENHLKTGFVALAVVFGYLSQYQEFIERYLEDYVDEYANELANAGFAFALSGLLLYALISVAISMGRTFLRFYGLKAQLEPEAVEIETGLLKRQYDRVPVRKVQFVEWSTNPLRRLVGFESAILHPSNPQGAVNRKQRIEIPALRVRQSTQLADGIFPGYASPAMGYKADAAAYVRINLIMVSFFLLPLIAWLTFQFGYPSLALLSLYPVLAFLSWQYGRRVALHLDERYLLLRRGWIFPERVVLPLIKLQSVSIDQNIFLKRRKLSHLKLYTAAGSQTVRYLNEEEAVTLYNYLLWCVERSDETWM
jgi:putative membrane protein